MELIELKTELQSRGAHSGALAGREGGAGPADGVTIFLGDLVVTVPTRAPYTARSPYSIEEDGGRWLLRKDGNELLEVELTSEPGFYNRSTPEGVSFKKIALRHGRDAIGTTVFQSCCHGIEACSFCSIDSSAASGTTTKEKRPADLARVSAAAAQEGYRHAVLTTGTMATPDRGIARLAECAEALRKASQMQVHVQFEPPRDISWISEAGRCAETCAINIESFDEVVRREVARGKARTSTAAYIEAWKVAVDVFGPGQVTSFIIVGLGESDSSVEEGAALLASLGVYPFLLPLRPLVGTRLEKTQPPRAARMLRLYEVCAGIVAEAGLDAASCSAGCVRCAACSAFPDMTG